MKIENKKVKELVKYHKIDMLKKYLLKSGMSEKKADEYISALYIDIYETYYVYNNTPIQKKDSIYFLVAFFILITTFHLFGVVTIATYSALICAISLLFIIKYKFKHYSK